MTPARMLLGILLVCALPAAADESPRARSSKDAPSTAPPPKVVEHGEASYYSDKFQGKPTASGEPHDQNALTAASKDLPLGSTATVTNLENGKAVNVEITDRGPFAPGRVIDLSKRAATSIGISKKDGTAPVRVEAKAAEQPTPVLKDKVATLSAKRAAKPSNAKASPRAKTVAGGAKPAG